MSSIRELREQARKKLAESVRNKRLSYDTPESIVLDVDALLSFSLGISREDIFKNLHTAVSEEEKGLFEKNLIRRLEAEPLAYILGEKEFFGLSFKVTPDVLIPRPETELLVEHALKKFDENLVSFTVVDIGVGSGAIVISILSELQKKYGSSFLDSGTFYALDVSAGALSLAKENEKKIVGAERIVFLESDLLSELPELSPSALTLFVTNPPYIENEAILPDDVERYEPRLALRAGAEGLDIYRRLAHELAEFKSSSPNILCEIGGSQAQKVLSIFNEAGLPEGSIHKDYSGLDRVLEILPKKP